jgi:hypothetical protein
MVFQFSSPKLTGKPKQINRKLLFIPVKIKYFFEGFFTPLHGKIFFRITKYQQLYHFPTPGNAQKPFCLFGIKPTDPATPDPKCPGLQYQMFSGDTDIDEIVMRSLNLLTQTVSQDIRFSTDGNNYRRQGRPPGKPVNTGKCLFTEQCNGFRFIQDNEPPGLHVLSRGC